MSIEALQAFFAVAPMWAQIWAFVGFCWFILALAALPVAAVDGRAWVGLLVLASAPLWPVAIVALLLALPELPWTEEGRLARQIRRVERRHALLAKARQMDAAEKAYFNFLETR